MSRKQNNVTEVAQVAEIEQVAQVGKTNEVVETTGTEQLITTSQEQPVEQVVAVEQPKYDVEALMSEHKTKSAVIRYLDSQGLKRGEIAKLLNIRYQHVRNTLVQPLKKK